jgi:tetratricopeptide (TPR) repeat protein
MADSDERFLERLSRGPAGLLLGQSHLALGSTTDPFLTVICRKLGVSGDTASTYRVVLSSTAAGSEFLDWLAAKGRTFVVSDQLEVITQYGWVGVWSSAIDPLWADAFESSRREVQRVFSEGYRPVDPRNRRRLHCTYLYGSTSRTEADERPPLTRLEYLRRRGISQSLARRVPIVLGPTGTLAIEAYQASDWFSVEDLVGIIAQMQAGQCHIFNATEELLGVAEIRELVASNLLVVHERSLAAVLADGNRAGIIELGASTEEGDLQRLVSFRGGTRSVPRDLWISLTASAHLLDESVLGDPRALSPEARYAEFRNFLGSAEGRPDWEGIARGFAFARDFEAALERRVSQNVAQRELHERPVVVHGAAGTGKTTALTVLAYRLAGKREVPVLFIDRRTERLDRDVVDRFCQWAEDHDASVTVLVWDGMHDLGVYEDLARFFVGRGRRVVVVGSAYRVTEQPTARGPELVLAPGELTADEIPRMEAFLGGFDERLRTLARLGEGAASSFLAFLYRLLPPTRASMRSGVIRELERVERTLAERSVATAEDYEPRTALGWALLDAGLLPDMGYARRESLDIAGETFTAIEDLTNLVMVPSQFGLSVPLELVLRTTGQDGYTGLTGILKDVDLVRWVEDRAGNFFLTARSRLEAELIVRSRLGISSAEAEYARRLLVEVKDKDTALSGMSEINFAVSLARALGAKGPSPDRYLPVYPTVADALRELREDHGLANPQLMLQESNLLREWSIRQPAEPGKRTEKLRALTEATSILSAALDLLPERAESTRLRSRLHVELATTLATSAQEFNVTTGNAEERLRLYDEACNIALQARAEEPQSYYPVDVLTWATRDVIRDHLLEDEDRAEAVAEVLSAFELIDPFELDAEQVERYYKRRLEFTQLAGELDLAEEAFDALASRSSGAGVYLRARAIADPSLMGEHPSAREREQARLALEYMSGYRELVTHDARCLNLELNLWWFVHAGQKLFADERYCLPFDRATWIEARSMLQRLEYTDHTYREVPLLFLRGLADFHLGDYAAAFATFSEVERRSDEVRGRRRIIRSYLASTPGARPVTYAGTVVRTSEDLRRGEVYVDVLRRRVPFIPREFGGRELANGANLGDFHIGFNFLGVIADPAAYFYSRRESR